MGDRAQDMPLLCKMPFACLSSGCRGKTSFVKAIVGICTILILIQMCYVQKVSGTITNRGVTVGLFSVGGTATATACCHI